MMWVWGYGVVVNIYFFSVPIHAFFRRQYILTATLTVFCVTTDKLSVLLFVVADYYL